MGRESCFMGRNAKIATQAQNAKIWPAGSFLGLASRFKMLIRRNVKKPSIWLLSGLGQPLINCWRMFQFPLVEQDKTTGLR